MSEMCDECGKPKAANQFAATFDVYCHCVVPSETPVHEQSNRKPQVRKYKATVRILNGDVVCEISDLTFEELRMLIDWN